MRAAAGHQLEMTSTSRDAMTRRVQYRRSIDDEWASYGPDTQAIAAAYPAFPDGTVLLPMPRLFIVATR